MYAVACQVPVYWGMVLFRNYVNVPYHLHHAAVSFVNQLAEGCTCLAFTEMYQSLRGLLSSILLHLCSAAHMHKHMRD